MDIPCIWTHQTCVFFHKNSNNCIART